MELTIADSCHLIVEALEAYQVDDRVISRASNHLSRKLKSYLFSSSPLARGNANGELYEALVYESILDIAARNDVVKRVAKKRIDVSSSRRTHTVTLDQDGLLYDDRGDLVIRGAGADLGEFDIVLFDNHGEVIFCEVTLSGNNLEGFEREILYKRHLLTELLGCKAHFLLISSKDIRNKIAVRSILSHPDNSFALFQFPNADLIRTVPYEKNKKFETIPSRDVISSKLCYWNELRTVRSLDYQKHHDQERETILSAIKNGEPKSSIKDSISSSLVQRVILGKLTERSAESLLGSKEFIIEGARLTNSDFKNLFSKVVVTLTLPRLRPIFYLNVKKNRNFLKMAAETISCFKFEKNITSDYSFAFHTWLDKAQCMIEEQELAKILDHTLTPDILGTKRKPGHNPNLG